MCRSMGLLILDNSLVGLQMANYSSFSERKLFRRRLLKLVNSSRGLTESSVGHAALNNRLEQYDKASFLLMECLQLAAVSNRKAIEDTLFLPPGEWTLK